MTIIESEEIDKAIAGTGWKRDGDGEGEGDGEGAAIVATFDRKDFVGALAFVNALGERAEAANHHPDIDIRWKDVTLRLSTHSAGGLTQKDLDLSREIDQIAAT